MLLEGSRTALLFGISINPNESNRCSIKCNTDLDNLVKESSLMICDEMPMMSKYGFKTLDRNLCDIVENVANKPLGGKVIVFGGDFRKILPVINGADRAKIVLASLNLIFGNISNY